MIASRTISNEFDKVASFAVQHRQRQAWVMGLDEQGREASP